MHVVQIQSVSLDELIQKIKDTSVQPKKINQDTGQGLISVLNKRGAAHTLHISNSLFDKLERRGLIPPTVNAGENNQGIPMMRWAHHHLLLIKPVIDEIKYCQEEGDYLKAKKNIYQILGL
jgi:hypothetical protein